MCNLILGHIQPHSVLSLKPGVTVEPQHIFVEVLGRIVAVRLGFVLLFVLRALNVEVR